jgi:hypothetical protein
VFLVVHFPCGSVGSRERGINTLQIERHYRTKLSTCKEKNCISIILFNMELFKAKSSGFLSSCRLARRRIGTSGRIGSASRWERIRISISIGRWCS